MPQQSEDIFRIVLIAALLLGAMMAYFILTMIRQQRKVAAWQRASIRAEIETLENERKRIAGDLHDEIGPMLSAIKLQLNHLEPEAEAEVAIQQKSSDQIDHIIQRFRDISFNLLPNTLVRKGLSKAAAEFINRMTGMNGITITFSAECLQLDKEHEINLYRIIQEIVHNAIKHSRATSLHITLNQNSEVLVLHAVDNGIGYLFKEQKVNGSGLGLLNLHSRVEVMNGQIKVNTAPGKGTAYSIQIPLHIP